MAYRIRELKAEERPRERLLQQGAQALKSSELIAILLRTGTQGRSVVEVAEELYQSFGSLEALSRATVQELAKIKGVGTAKAVELKAAFTLGARLSRSEAASLPVETGEDVCVLLGEEMRLLDYESVRVVCLNSKHKVLGVEEISRGTVNESLIHPREVFRPAISRQATKIVVVHNHPSGDPAPSAADHRVTRQLLQAGAVLHIALHDHVILGSAGRHSSKPYFSFREHGLLSVSLDPVPAFSPRERRSEP